MSALSVVPDEMAHYDLRCLQKFIIIAYISERVIMFNKGSLNTDEN